MIDKFGPTNVNYSIPKEPEAGLISDLCPPTSDLYYYLVAFFLLATVLRFPLRVRELFLVRWPRKGKPLR